MNRTFVDAGVLIAGARGNQLVSATALAILTDPTRVFLSSPFIQLEVLLKAHYFKQTNEVRFYEAFFRSVGAWAVQPDLLLQRAFDLAPATVSRPSMPSTSLPLRCCTPTSW